MRQMEVVHIVKGARKKDAKGDNQPDKNKKLMNIGCQFCGRQHQRNKRHCLAIGQVCKLYKQKNKFLSANDMKIFNVLSESLLKV